MNNVIFERVLCCFFNLRKRLIRDWSYSWVYSECHCNRKLCMPIIIWE